MKLSPCFTSPHPLRIAIPKPTTHRCLLRSPTQLATITTTISCRLQNNQRQDEQAIISEAQYVLQSILSQLQNNPPDEQQPPTSKALQVLQSFTETYSKLSKLPHITLPDLTPILSKRSTTSKAMQLPSLCTDLLNQICQPSPEQQPPTPEAPVSRSVARLRELRRALFSKRVAGSAKNRNVNLLAVHMDHLRAHRCARALPAYSHTLARLAQDGAPFRAALELVGLPAWNAGALLGLYGDALGALAIPDGRKRQLHAWKRAVTGGGDMGFSLRFRLAHVANGALVYLEEMQARFKKRCRIGAAYPGVLLEEVGILALGEEHLEPLGIESGFMQGLPLVACTPAGMLWQRVESQFWEWEQVAKTVVLVVCDAPYEFVRMDVGGERFRFKIGGETRMDCGVFVEAQLAMLCAGRVVRNAHVICYSVLGGVVVYEIERDDAVLRDVMLGLKQSAGKWVPPAPGDEFVGIGADSLEKVKRGCEQSVMWKIEEGRAEKILQGMRESEMEWQYKRNVEPFLYQRIKQ